jgi:serine/threonine-protein kinase
MLVQMTRRLRRAGYEHADLVRAMREDLDERRGDLASTYGSSNRPLDRWLNRFLIGGLSTHLGALGWMAFGPYFEGIEVVIASTIGVSLFTWIGAGTAAAVRHQLADHLPGQGWLRFWESGVGRTLFRASGARLQQLPAGAPYGPTELAIGLAADRLFETLPAEQREAFAELPDVVRRLEGDAERMRAHIRGLDGLIAELGTHPGDAEQALLGSELRGARAAAEERLRQVVAALETIRIELLRLHAGAATVESVTQDLSAAKEIAEDVARLLASTREVDRLLQRPTPPEWRSLPTPA